jgi:hypothetical protein
MGEIKIAKREDLYYGASCKTPELNHFPYEL